MRKKQTKPMIEELKAQQKKAADRDLSNQTLSNDPAERARQLDYQAQQSERLQTDS